VDATPPAQDRRDGQVTLGDVLYAGKATAPVSEKVWVELVRSVAGGDQLALHALYTQTHRLVFTLIMRIIGNRDTAEELTIDVFYDVWRRAPSYEPAGGSVIGWIMNQARSRAIDRLRFEQRQKRAGDPADLPLTATAGRGPEETFTAAQQGRVVRDALRVLTPEERSAIEAAFFSELTYREVATRLNQPLGTVKTRIRSGLRKLRQALSGALKDP
jgi:RNA polymerase sigma-70 factor, ECF subfamily